MTARKMAVIYDRYSGEMAHVHDEKAYERLMSHSPAHCTCSPPVHDDGRMREFDQRLQAPPAAAARPPLAVARSPSRLRPEDDIEPTEIEERIAEMMGLKTDEKWRAQVRALKLSARANELKGKIAAMELRQQFSERR